ncbi:MAG: substrate-binding domain-containing protein [Thermodesulfobacteriota bacterium]
MQPALMMGIVKKVCGLWVRLFLFLFLFPALFPAVVRADTLEIPGTGACEVLLRAVARAFTAKYPDHQVLLPPSVGTSGGIRAVRQDQAVLARVAQSQQGDQTTQGLQYRVFAQDMTIFAVGGKVTVKDLTSAQIVDVYTGKITDWRELGGDPGPIRLLARQPGDSNLKIIQENLPSFRNITYPPSAKVTHTDPKMLEMLQKYKYAIGWLTFSALKGAQTPVYPLALDGIAPTPETARSGKYKFLGPYALVYKEERLNNLARLFLDFIFSKECQQLMEQYGVIPVDKE